jgi:hypothetical protein
MRRTFEVRRETSEQPDGQTRWDRAYQLVLGWAATPATAEQEGAADGAATPPWTTSAPPSTRGGTTSSSQVPSLPHSHPVSTEPGQPQLWRICGIAIDGRQGVVL